MTHSFSSQMTAQLKAMHQEQFGHDLSCSEIFNKMQADPSADKWQTFMLSMAYRSQSEIEERETRHATAPASTVQTNPFKLKGL